MLVQTMITHSGAALHACSVGAVPGHANALSASCWPVLLLASVSDLHSKHIINLKPQHQAAMAYN